MTKILCKWCRAPIISRVEIEDLLPSYIHETGLFSCLHHAETSAEPADPSWEGVFGFIRPTKVFPGLVQFTIEICFLDGRKIYQSFMASEERLTAQPEQYGYILDGMVEALDTELNRRGIIS